MSWCRPSSYSASRRPRRNQRTPHLDPEAVERATGPAAVPWLLPPAAFARKLHPASDAAAVERARGPAAVPWLPPAAAFARGLHSAPRAAPPNPTPIEPQAHPPTLPPSFSRRRGRRNRGREAEKEEEGQGARCWAALPRDALAAVLRRLDHVEILMGPGQVCRSWRRAARDDPALWRRIDMGPGQVCRSWRGRRRRRRAGAGEEAAGVRPGAGGGGGGAGLARRGRGGGLPSSRSYVD
ncbi:hypothetical protein BAE44_0002155 [Dichanthelium oligosanthes]|uniref:F-box domain-containing protein n=1 Tax=Dichanthelium oligosanthes TaxID=888268 RepID=A0A1E5WHF4_9POAL|nr:hypothetical protein BAE44_0002155 [Dichanthelium oligosanthes]